MSADNSIIILITPKDSNDKLEYRVIHCLAEDNLFWNDKKQDYEFDKSEVNPIVLMDYFKDAKVFDDSKKAFDYALELENEVGYVEYGIHSLTLTKPFSHYKNLVK